MFSGEYKVRRRGGGGAVDVMGRLKIYIIIIIDRGMLIFVLRKFVYIFQHHHKQRAYTHIYIEKQGIGRRRSGGGRRRFYFIR